MKKILRDVFGIDALRPLQQRIVEVVEPASIQGRYRHLRPLRVEELDPEGIEDKKRRDLTRLLHVVELAQSEDIRAYVLDYFELGARLP